MGRNTALLESPIAKCYGAIGTVPREMFERGTISKQLQNMNVFEPDIAISTILNHPYFIRSLAKLNRAVKITDTSD